MKAVTFAKYGGPDVLRVEDVDEPHPEAGQVRIAVRAASVNPFDCRVRSGSMSERIPLELPAITGHDGAGVVDEVGPEVTGTAVGDEVFGFTVGITGAAAEYALLGDFARKPTSLAWEQAAAMPVVVETSARAFRYLGDVGAGNTLLINGAAGGVGLAAVQLAIARGASVIGTASEGNHEFLRSLGAQATTYGEGLVERVRALAPDGVDRAFDTAGKGALPDLIELTGDPARVITIADPDAERLGVYISHGSDVRASEALTEAAELAQGARFQLPIERTFGFSEAAEAHSTSEGGHVRGKLLLIPD
ncbi:MAG TPA: NADP-dependent oxidoreductase [Baekduia sp.]|nr:NADP-dependent oxidoreductase [Baekduia sp.]